MPASTDPAISVVVPALNEAGYLRECLASVRTQEVDREYEVVVVDGGSDDGTVEIAREFDATVHRQPGSGIADARNAGAERADGEWLAFVDADTVLRPTHLETMLSFVERGGLTAASSRCRMVGPRRAKLMEWTINHVFPRLDRPVLPGFNFVVERATFERAGGFPEVPNEDTALSRQLARTEPTGYCPDVLVESSARRIRETGLTGTAYHYLALDWRRVRAEH